MTFRKIITFGLFCVACTLATACENSSAPSSTSANAPAANANTNGAPSTAKQPSYTVPGSSPTDTIKAWREAVRKKDADAFVKTYAQVDVDFMKQKAKEDGLALNAWVKHGYLDNPNLANAFPPALEVSNEQITGDTATLSIKNKKGRIKTAMFSYDGGQLYSNARLYFVKENGEWKLSPKSAPPFTKEERDKLDQELLDDMDN